MDTQWSPTRSEYVNHLHDIVVAWFDHALANLQGGDALGTIALWVVGLGLPLSLGLLLLGRLRRRHRRLRPAQGAAPTEPDDPITVDPGKALAHALASQDGRSALGALWRYVGMGLEAAGRGHWSTDQTEREFIATVRRAAPGWAGLAELEDLRGAVVVGVYGPQSPPMEAVRALLPRAEALLAVSDVAS